MRYMLCYALMQKSAKVEAEYFDQFEDAVMRYTVLCSNCEDVVLAETTEAKIIRHYSYRHTANGASVTSY